ncbi:hypothetical protein KC323_g8080 [Hortaea werneckii]|nr:hypothetical protein KC323_g8080 [Hortaea werneckii]
MLDQAAASYNISEAQAIANLREKRGNPDDNEDNIIFRALAMKIKYGSAVNGDGCGRGKTIMYLAPILSATEYRLRQPEDFQERRPTFIAGPNDIAKKWTKTARNARDRNWQELGNTSAEKVAHFPYLSGRVCVDGLQRFRHALKTKKGMALTSFCARFRHCYTVTICYENPYDINGHLAFLERATWTENRDWNAYKHGNPRFGENALCTEARWVLHPGYTYRPDAEVDVDMDNESEDSNGQDCDNMCCCIPTNEPNYDHDK